MRVGRIAVEKTMGAAVRKRPGMYLGDLKRRGVLVDLVEQVLCAACDEAIGGTCTHVEVVLEPDGVIEVRDDGLGLPVDPVPHSGMPACEHLLTQLAACRAMRRDPYTARRFCGHGIVVANALSAWLELDTCNRGQRHRQRYEQGHPCAPPALVGATTAHGTSFRFRPDPVFFGRRQVPAARLERTLAEIRALAPGVQLELHDRRGARRPAGGAAPPPARR